VVLVTFTALTLQPLTAAAQLPSAPKPAQTSSTTGEERFSRTLNEIHEILKEVVPQAAMPHRPKAAAPAAPGKPGEKVLQAVGPKMRLESERAKPLPGVDVAAKVKTLRAKYKELKSLEGEVDKSFKATEQHIRDKKLPAEILARHEAAVAEYEKRKAEFGTLMAAVEAAADGKGELQPALSSLGDFMAKYPNEKTHTPTDPNNLPWGSPKPVTRAPYTTPAQFKTSRLFGEPVKVAQAGSISGISLPNTVLPDTPMPADTAPTEDVQITQPIKDLATSLGNNPVKIYNWVRNNIAFIPSYGSIQGSDMTLQTKRGNSFDTASLLIALLRAANVPARYVYGTIEVPADRALNWVGGVSVPEAVMNLLGQGGIPNRGTGAAGQIRAIRLEHVWVEAFVDYVPSRGAVNRNPNTWVPMDASFKQYQFTQGMDIKTNVPFDSQSLIAQLKQGATINEAEGWVQNINQAQVQQSLSNYQVQVASYINARQPTATVADVVGTQTVIQETRSILLGTLPYARVATGAKFQAVPASLRWMFRYNVYASDTDRALDNPFISSTLSTPSIAGKRINLSFTPATPGDQAVINSFLPPPHADGTPVQASELPSSFPGYLIRLVPTLQIEGQVIGSGPALTMGTEILQNAAYFNPATGQWEGQGEDNRPTVGDYTATALDLQGAGSQQLTALSSKLNLAQTLLAQFLLTPSDPASAGAITNDNILGRLFDGVINSYFAEIDQRSQIGALAAGTVTFRMPSFGNFGLTAQTLFSFGVPRSVSTPELTLDVDRVIAAEVSKDGDSSALRTFRRAMGAQFSSLENLVPEKIFTDLTDPNRPQGLSAVKAIGVAASQGQRIYTLNQQNQAIHDSVLAQLGIDAAVKQELSDALAAGKEVTVHEANISFSGFTGAGYIVLDPDTGAGAYKIAGGANGLKLVLKTLGAALGVFAGSAHGGNNSPEFLGIVLGFLADILIHMIKSALAGILKQIADFLDTFSNILAACSGVALVFVSYIYFAIQVMALVLTGLLFGTSFLAIFIGALLSFLINAFINDVVTPLICAPRVSGNRREWFIYAKAPDTST
jgi:hypothetical protein